MRKGRTSITDYLLMNREWTLDLDGTHPAYYPWAQNVVTGGKNGMIGITAGINKVK